MFITLENLSPVVTTITIIQKIYFTSLADEFRAVFITVILRKYL